MGTNYYHVPDPCPHCGRGEREHIGKSSGGWTFSFHGTEEIRSFREWVARLAEGGRIVDEYGTEHTLESFRNLVATKRDERNNHAKLYPSGSWLDADGHSFSGHEFS